MTSSDYGNSSFKLVENAGALRCSSIGRVHHITSPGSLLDSPFTRASVTTSTSDQLWPWIFVVATRKSPPTIHLLELSKIPGGFQLAMALSVPCGLSHPWGLAVHENGDTVTAACERFVVSISLRSKQIVSSLEVKGQARGICYLKRGDLLVADYQNHTICVVKDGKFASTWGTSSVPGNTDGPLETTLFDGPCMIASEGNTAFVICEGSLFGARIVRCCDTAFLKQYLFNLHLLYVLLGYNPTRRNKASVRSPTLCLKFVCTRRALQQMF